MRLAVDADVCIYAVNQTPWTQSVRHSLRAADELVGSTLLPVEVLTKPIRLGLAEETAALEGLLRGLRLIDVGLPLAALATTLAAQHGLRAVDAIHLATAVMVRADAFLTNNTSDFSGLQVEGTTIVFPEPAPGRA